MAEITKRTPTAPSMSSVLVPPNCRLTGLKAGEALGALDACRIGTDGLVYRASGAAANANAKVRGWASQATPVGEAVTLLHNVNVGYGAGLTPGADYYLSGTVLGGIADTPSTGGTQPIAFAFDQTRIFIKQSNY